MTESRPVVPVVGDDPDVRFVLQRFLRHLLADHDILVVADSEAALTFLSRSYTIPINLLPLVSLLAMD